MSCLTTDMSLIRCIGVTLIKLIIEWHKIENHSLELIPTHHCGSYKYECPPVADQIKAKHNSTNVMKQDKFKLLK